MSPFENLVDAIHGLSGEEKLRLRLLLDEELKISPVAPASNRVRPSSSLIGLFSDEPELIDRVMDSVYEQRARPLRTNEMSD